MTDATDKENTLILTLDTGPVTIQLLPDKAPGHVARIKELVREGFYDGLTFHRVIDRFMAQGGCPEGTGMGGSGKKLKAEFNDVSHQRGVCSMARVEQSGQRRQPVLHRVRRCKLPRQAIHRVGQGHERHGECRQAAEGRAAANARARSCR